MTQICSRERPCLLYTSNVSVYLPLGVCDKCRNTGGEDILGEAIATAEEWAGTGMGLEVDPKTVSYTHLDVYKRQANRWLCPFLLGSVRPSLT